MSLFGILVIGFLVYLLYKSLRGSSAALFGSQKHQEPPRDRAADADAAKAAQQQKTKVVKHDEGEYVDFEEIKDDK